MKPQGRRARLVFNRRHRDAPKNSIYVGRPSAFGNPFVIGIDGTRTEVLAKYRAYALANPELLEKIRRLKGLPLVCFCHPLPCHADILVELSQL